MGSKKMKRLPILCQPTAETTWPPWPTCINNPTTHSFRADIPNDKTTKADHFAETSDDSFFSNSEVVLDSSNIDETAVMCGLMSDRLFFEPGKTNSILEEAAEGHDKEEELPGVAVVEMESRDPVEDFRVSMEEMVEACGLKLDWEWLEELLACYLKVNGRHNHGYIVGAFEDLLLHLDLSRNCSSRRRTSSSITNCCSNTNNTSAMDDEQYPCGSSNSSSTAHCSFTFSSSTYSSTTHYCLSVLENEEDDDLHHLH